MPGASLGGQGWLRDLPDVRDFDPSTPAVRDVLSRLKRRRGRNAPRPAAVDHGEFLAETQVFDPPESAARTTGVDSAAALVRYFERRATGRIVDLAPRFLYYTARRLDELAGDTGISLRTVWKALVRFGCPPLRFGPSPTAPLDAEPGALAFAYQREFAGLQYVRLDPPGVAGSALLERIKAFVAAGFACVCGCMLAPPAGDDVDIPYPTKLAGATLGTTLVVVGYDDQQRIRSSHGALVVRTTFGGAGRGRLARLPYRYVETGLACDVWTLLKPEWLAGGEFEQPAA